MQTLAITQSPLKKNPPSAPLGRLARARHAAAEIAPETIERIAQRVVQLLHHQPDTHDDANLPAQRDLMDAGQLARHLGLTRAWVYEHADQLGAIPVGDGPRPRLRFDPQTAMKALNTRQRRREPKPMQTDRPRPGRPRRNPASSTVPLLPVHEPRTRGILARWQRHTRRRRG